MALDAVWSLLSEAVFPVASTEALFNPYRDRREALDVPNAPAIRRENLRSYLACYEEAPPLFLLAEAPGPWGCRFSGIPFTSEAQLEAPDFPIEGTRTSRSDELHTEYSASIYWRVLQPYFPYFFTWNSVPLHPHDPGAPLSIRNPRRSEVREWQDLLRALLDLLQPTCIAGVGRKAERALDEVGADATYVRHPSQGGATKFEAGMLDLIEALGLERTRKS